VHVFGHSVLEKGLEASELGLSMLPKLDFVHAVRLLLKNCWGVAESLSDLPLDVEF